MMCQCRGIVRVRSLTRLSRNQISITINRPGSWTKIIMMLEPVDSDPENNPEARQGEAQRYQQFQNNPKRQVTKKARTMADN